MKIKKIISLLLLTSFFFGCTSAPEVRRARQIQIDYKNNIRKYDVVINNDYMENPDELKYAINSFVKEQGGASYDVEQHGSNDFYVTIPGEIPVEDLPEIKHFDVGKTIWLGIGGSAGAVLILGIIVSIFMSPSQ
jgi:hypothetical protein